MQIRFYLYRCYGEAPDLSKQARGQHNIFCGSLLRADVSASLIRPRKAELAPLDKLQYYSRKNILS